MEEERRSTPISKHYLFLCQLLLGMILGIALGLGIRRSKHDKCSLREVMYINFPGEIVLRMLKAIVPPLIVTCIISFITSVEKVLSFRVGLQFLLYILLTNFQCSILAAVVALITSPGLGFVSEEYEGQTKSSLITETDKFLDLIRNLFPSNLVLSVLSHYNTVLINSNNDTRRDIYKWTVSHDGKMVDGVNTWGIVCASIVIGMAMKFKGEICVYMVELTNSFKNIIILIMHWILWISPIGFVFIIAAQITVCPDFQFISKLGVYFSLLWALYLIQCLIVYPLIYVIFVRKNPFIFLFNFSEAIVACFVTASTYSSLPFAVKCMTEKSKVDRRILEFVLCFGTVFNKDGAVIYQTFTMICIAQMNEVSLNMGDLSLIILVCSISSITLTAIPSSANLLLIVLLEGRGIPLRYVSVVLAIDWFFQRGRAMVNVLGSAIAAGILEHYNKEFLESTESEGD